MKTTYVLKVRNAGSGAEFYTLKIFRSGQSEPEIHTGGRAYVMGRIPAGAVEQGQDDAESLALALKTN